MSSRADRGCVLFVSPGPNIASPFSGEGARLHHLSRGLSEDWSVVTLAPAGVADDVPWADAQYTYDGGDNPFLTDLNGDFLSSLWAVLREHDVDVVHLSRGVCGAKVLATIQRSPATVVYAAQNVEAAHESDLADDSAVGEKRSMGPRTVAAVERFSVACADRLTTVSEGDREAFVDRYDVDPTRIRAIPTGTTPVDAESLPSKSSVRERFGIDADSVAVFHGWYRHRPNQEAVSLVADVVAPAVRERGLDVEFLLVGKGMPPVEAPNVTAVGFVDDLFAVLHAADFAVVPTLHGGGTKTKVFDYLSVGLPIVATENGVGGIDVEPGTHCLVSSGVDEEFVDHVARLASDVEHRAEMGRAVTQLARELGWSRSVDRLDGFYRGLS